MLSQVAVETLNLLQDWAGLGAVKRPGKLDTGGTAARNAVLLLRNWKIGDNAGSGCGCRVWSTAKLMEDESITTGWVCWVEWRAIWFSRLT